MFGIVHFLQMMKHTRQVKYYILKDNFYTNLIIIENDRQEEDETHNNDDDDPNEEDVAYFTGFITHIYIYIY